MKRFSRKSLTLCLLLGGMFPLGACSDDPQTTSAALDAESTAPVAGSTPGDIIARVGDQAITFSEINTMLNSSAVVGLSIPALGTPERDTVRIALLDKVISANLLYLDALRKGVDDDPVYRRDMQRFSRSLLAELYYQRHMVGDITVTEAEIQDYFKEEIVAGTEMSDELHAGIEATLRKRKLEQRQSEQRGKLRDNVKVTVYQKNFSPEGDDERDNAALIAEAGDETITWGEMKDRLIAAGKGAVKRDILAMEIDARLGVLQREIDNRLLAQKARAAGLETDEVFRKRTAEYAKTRLINLHRAGLAAQMEPDDGELAAYFEANRAQISSPEFRKVQMVMVETEQQAKDLKAQIEDGELTLYQAAAEHSAAPDAKQNLGELGWIGRGKTKPQLDELIFSLLPGEIGGPVEAGGLWHIMTVLDVRDAQYSSLDDQGTRQHVRRRLIHEKLDDYVVELRRKDFPVQVYEDEMIRLAQQEVDMVKTLAAQSEDPASVTRKRLEEMQRLMQK